MWMPTMALHHTRLGKRLNSPQGFKCFPINKDLPQLTKKTSWNQKNIHDLSTHITEFGNLSHLKPRKIKGIISFESNINIQFFTLIHICMINY